MISSITNVAKTLIDCAVILVLLPWVLTGIVFTMVARRRPRHAGPRLLWGSVPVISLSHMAKAAGRLGYESKTVVGDVYDIFADVPFDYVLAPRRSPGSVLGRLERTWNALVFFPQALRNFDIFHFYFDGGILFNTILRGIEFPVLKALGKKLVLFPYGSDAFVLDEFPNPMWKHAMMIEYGVLGNKAEQIQRRIRKRTSQADVVVGCLCHHINLPRWDILPLTCYPFDDEGLQLALSSVDGVISIAHATNHRGFKGTTFLEHAVKELQAEGFNIELDVIEAAPHNECMRRINACDIYVDQLVAGYAQAAIEGMALGKVVVSPVENTPYYDMFRTYSYLDECPIVNANTQTIKSTLRTLIEKREDWPEIGKKGHSFVKRRHSMEANSRMWDAIYQHIWWGKKDVDLINYYHPLIGKERRAFNRDTH